MKRLVLQLTATERAVFSRRAATEGEHQTLPCPTGAALLGWAANRGRYTRFQDPYTVFHSGKTRFSNALPLSESGLVAWPVPQILMEAKHGGHSSKGRMLDAATLTIGRDNDNPADGRIVQREPLKGFFISRTGEVVKATVGGRLRTAIRRGRAADGQLFGYQHIEPGGTSRYVATIEADDLSDRDWHLLCAAFDSQVLRLGRAAGTSYGGGYHCKILDADADAVWPCGRILAGATTVRIWVLSDLALTDALGAPCFAPDTSSLGLPPGAIAGGESAIGVRRYAPWNRTLRARDIERQVIEAGSVLTFTFDAPVAATIDHCGRAGQWQEAGLGRIWVAPPMLAAAAGGAPDFDATNTVPKLPAGQKPSDDAAGSGTADPNDPLIAWLRAQQQLAQQTESQP